MARFMAKAREDRSGHWRWQGARTPHGYGKFTWAGRSSIGAHRAAWRLFHGDIPDGMQVHHACGERDCVNPGHLMVTTARANTVERSRRKGRIEVCKHGHPMVGDNIAWTTGRGKPVRYCRECARINSRAMYAKHAEARRAYAREKYRRTH